MAPQENTLANNCYDALKPIITALKMKEITVDEFSQKWDSIVATKSTQLS